MMRSFVNLYKIDTGMETSHVLTMSFLLPTRKYNNPQMRNEFLRRMEERLNTVDTVVGASITNSLPLFGGAARQLTIEGKSAQADKPQIVTVLDVGSRYFDAVGVSVTRGRAFDAIEGSKGREVAVINQRLASMYFPNEEPIGQRIRLADDSPGAARFEWATIVGIVPNIRQRTSQDDPAPDPVVYIPYSQDPTFIGAASLIVRGRLHPATLTPLLRKEMFALDPDLPLNNVHTMDENLAQRRWFSRVFGTMFSVFAGIAIVLSAVGLFAVTAYSVTQRTQEIGVRMALGAQSHQMRWLILRRGLVHLAFGLVFGLAGAFGVGRLLRNQLFQTGSGDPVILVLITMLLVMVAIVACLWPAWQATRLNPVAALRYE
jgi:putative ABC transport system permease protein